MSHKRKQKEVDSDEERYDPKKPFSVSTNFENDQSKMLLKVDHALRPIWICRDNAANNTTLYRIFLETFSPIYKQAYDFLISIAEPICRPNLVHEYQVTPYSLHAAVSVGLEPKKIINTLDRLAKNHLPPDLLQYIKSNTASYGKG